MSWRYGWRIDRSYWYADLVQLDHQRACMITVELSDYYHDRYNNQMGGSPKLYYQRRLISQPQLCNTSLTDVRLTFQRQKLPLTRMTVAHSRRRRNTINRCILTNIVSRPYFHTRLEMTREPTCKTVG
jgi:hypothetical protein